MADYRFVKCKFWSDPYILDLEPDEKTVFLWLFTNEHSNQAGIYPVSLKTIAFETGYPIDRVSEIIDRLSRDGKVVYTEEKILWVKNFLRHQPNKSPKVLTRVAEDLKSLNNNKLVEEYLRYYHDLSIPYRYPINKEPTKEKEKEKVKVKENIIETTNVVSAPNRKENNSEPPKSPSKSKINFNFETGEWENIPEEDIDRWKKTYPACDIRQELLEMADWLLNNPQKRKKNYRRFISNWLSREQERGGTRRPGFQSYRDLEKAKLEAELRVGRKRDSVPIPNTYLEKRIQKEQELWERLKPKIKRGEISMKEAEGQVKTALAQWHESNFQDFQQGVRQ